MRSLLLALATSLSLLPGCADEEETPSRPATVTVSTETAVAEVDERFLSFAVDTAQVVGGLFWDPSGEDSGGTGSFRVPPYDFGRERIRALAAELAPAYVRVGGTDADKTYYDLGDDPVDEPPEPYEWVLTRAEWAGVNAFAADLGLEVAFTLNAGPGPRDEDGAWLSDQARLLVEHSVAEGYPVALWELGNEVNAFAAMHGFDNEVEPAQLAADLATLRALVDEVAPGSLVAGPASAYWPLAGETPRFLAELMDSGGGEHLDVVTWHYYPMQSRRCPFANLRAAPELPLDPEVLDEVLYWAEEVEEERDEHAPDAEVWLGETGGAQCGGEPGVSNAFVGTFWWLDQLGSLARRGMPVVVRQTLSGATYGLVDDETLEPMPDYWASLLWRRLMGPRVLDASVEAGDPLLRAYAHCARGGPPGAVAVLLLNLDQERAAEVSLEGAAGPQERYVASADALDAQLLRLGSAELRLGEGGELPALEPDAASGGRVRLPPTSWAFVVLPEAGAAGCR